MSVLHQAPKELVTRGHTHHGQGWSRSLEALPPPPRMRQGLFQCWTWEVSGVPEEEAGWQEQRAPPLEDKGWGSIAGLSATERGAMAYPGCAADSGPCRAPTLPEKFTQ